MKNKKLLILLTTWILTVTILGCTTRQQDWQIVQPQAIVTETKQNNLPDRAIALGLSEPEWLSFDKEESRQTYVNQDAFDSVTLIYTGEYEKSLQQAKIIADKAKIPISKEFEMAQNALDGLSEQEIAQITSGNMLRWIVYANSSLLATNMEYLVTISVDENGTLTIEAVNYSQMKK